MLRKIVSVFGRYSLHTITAMANISTIMIHLHPEVHVLLLSDGSFWTLIHTLGHSAFMIAPQSYRSIKPRLKFATCLWDLHVYASTHGGTRHVTGSYSCFEASIQQDIHRFVGLLFIKSSPCALYSFLNPQCCIQCPNTVICTMVGPIQGLFRTPFSNFKLT